MESLAKLAESTGNIEAARRSAKRALDMLVTISETKEFRDKAKAVEEYLRNREACNDLLVLAGEIKVRSERKLGELLLANGWKKQEPGIKPVVVATCRAIALAPRDDFEEYIDDLVRCGKPPNTTNTYHWSVRLRNPTARAAPNYPQCRRCAKLIAGIRLVAARIAAGVRSDFSVELEELLNVEPKEKVA